MSLTDIVSSTLSTLVSNLIVVVNDENINRSSRFLPSITDFRESKVGVDNATISMSTSSPTKTARYQYVGQGVAHGFSQEKIITVMCMLIIFSIFGCLGNGLVLYVFTKKSDKVTSTIFILALAWTDFFTCLIIIPFTVANIGLDSRLHFDFLCKAYQFLITSNVPLSAFIMVAIAVDRYFSICHPFMRVVTPRRARIAIIGLVMVACTLGSITACIYGVWSQTSLNNTSTSSRFYCNDTFNNSFPECVTSSGQDLAQEPEGKRLSAVTSMHADVEIVVDQRSFSMSVMNTTASNSGYHPSYDYPVREHSEGLCVPNEIIFSFKFTELYQKIYISFYIISLLAVFTLYFFIYRSVAERREWRRKQKSFSHAPMTATTAAEKVDNCKTNKDVNYDRHEHLELATQNSLAGASISGSKDNGTEKECGNAANSTTESKLGKTTSAADSATKSSAHENGVEPSNLSSTADKKTNRERRDFNFLANIRTAIMLFVVTLVFIVNFLPAWLMATHIISFEIVIFYTHFIYNVANPVIYAFMNQSFRKELKRVFQRDCMLDCRKPRQRMSSGRNYSRTAMTAVSSCDCPEETKGYQAANKNHSQDS